MTDRSKLLALAASIEAMSGPDRDVDAKIFAAVRGFPEGVYQRRNAARPKYARPLDRMTWLAGWGVSAYTGSIDAAMTLVPEGRDVMFAVIDGRAYAGTGKERSDADIEAATPSLALCAAALRAQAEALA